MIIIAHGNDIAASRTFYISTKSDAKNQITLDGQALEFNQFFQTFEGNSLFELEKNVFIENFFSSKKSNSIEVKKIVDYINNKKDLNLFFWEPKELTKAQASLIKAANVKLFNYPQLLFNFLDNIKPSNTSLISLFKDLQKQMETELILYMIIRQFRLLLSVALASGIDEALRMAPWQRSKLEKQARSFENAKLIEAYKKIYRIDYETKFGLSSMTTDKRIDIFLASL